MFGAGYNQLPVPWRLGPAGAQLDIGGMHPALAALGALGTALLTAFAIRLMDEHLDRFADALAERTTVGRYLGDAAMPYALLSFTLATLIQPRLAVVLFLSAYAVGMAGDLRRPLPSRLTGLTEAVLAIAAGIVGGGWVGACWGLCCMGAVQCCDDYFDRSLDARNGQHNLCRRWGTGEVIMLGLLLLMLAIRLSPLLTAVIIAAALLSSLAWSKLAQLADRHREDIWHDYCD